MSARHTVTAISILVCAKEAPYLVAHVEAYLAGGCARLRGMVRILLSCATLAVALLISGCAGSTLSEAEQQAAVAAASSPAKLQPGDKIRIVVFGEDNLNGEYQVDQGGQISLPLRPQRRNRHGYFWTFEILAAEFFSQLLLELGLSHALHLDGAGQR
jgi:hypothetical protein